jgi:hypothetical protein
MPNSSSTSRLIRGQDDEHGSSPVTALAHMSQPSSPQATSPTQQGVSHGRESSHGSSSGLYQHQSASQQAPSKPEQATETNPNELPFLSVEAALAWKKQMKSGIHTPIQDEELLNRLKKRDHVSPLKYALLQSFKKKADSESRCS